MKQVLFTVYGRVQGVFFRAGTQTRALELGVKGWVKNNEDGSVSICAQGNSAALEKFIEWCKTGPLGAKIIRIKQKKQRPTPALDGFKIIY